MVFHIQSGYGVEDEVVEKWARSGSPPRGECLRGEGSFRRGLERTDFPHPVETGRARPHEEKATIGRSNAS